MHRRLRIDVRERVAVIVLVDGLGGNASFDDPAEKAARHYRQSNAAATGASLICSTGPLLQVESSCFGITAPPAPFRVLAILKKALNDLPQISVDRAKRHERNIHQPVFAASLHQLRNAAIPVDVHDDKGAVSALDLNHFTQDRNFCGLPIRFNNNAGYSGTH
jgi:hypothetical protein